MFIKDDGIKRCYFGRLEVKDTSQNDLDMKGNHLFSGSKLNSLTLRKTELF